MSLISVLLLSCTAFQGGNQSLPSDHRGDSSRLGNSAFSGHCETLKQHFALCLRFFLLLCCCFSPAPQFFAICSKAFNDCFFSIDWTLIWLGLFQTETNESAQQGSADRLPVKKTDHSFRLDCLSRANSVYNGEMDRYYSAKVHWRQDPREMTPIASI